MPHLYGVARENLTAVVAGGLTIHPALSSTFSHATDEDRGFDQSVTAPWVLRGDRGNHDTPSRPAYHEIHWTGPQ
jgi:hypothetical protein